MFNRDEQESEIFSLYAEALEKADSDWRESPEIKKYKSETNPRLDSMSLKDIELLYPAPSEESIIDQAHPDLVVISPAYDKINGLVENEKQRQAIDIYNVLKGSPWGGPTQHKLAKKDLLLELTKIANFMDSKNNLELTSLADECIEDLAIKKEAAIPLIVAGLSLAAVLGYGIFINKSLPSDQGIKNNCQKAIDELEDLTEDHQWTQWFHQNVNDTVKSQLSDLKYRLEELKQIAEQYNNLEPSFTMRKVSDLAQLKDAGAKAGFLSNIKVVDSYLSKIKEVLPLISNCLDGLKWSAEHTNTEEDSAWWSTLTKLWRTVSSDDIEDATRYLKTLQESCKKALQEALGVRKWADSEAAEIEGSMKPASPEEFTPKQPQMGLAASKTAQLAGQELNEKTLFIYAKPYIDRLSKAFPAQLQSGYFIEFNPSSKITILRTNNGKAIAPDIEKQINQVILNALNTGEILLPRNAVRIDLK